MTTITVIGNASRDPELRYTPNGTAVATFGLAVNKRKKAANGEWEDAGTDWFNVTCWRELGQNVADSITKGTRVVVTGRLEQRSWEDRDGTKRLSVEINADEIGPSLRWATVTVNRNERSDSTRGGWTGGATPGPGGPPAAYDPSEEPF